MINNKQLQMHIRGTLIGVAYGDALGMPTEYWTREHIKAVFPSGVTTFYESTKDDFFHRQMRKGEVTDDTINTILILQAILDADGKLDVNDYIKRLNSWRDDVGIAQYVCGPNTMKALDLIKQGVSIQDSGKFGTTNGAAMKIAPIGMIRDYHDMKGLVDQVEQLCIPTHNTSIAIAGASVVAACISYGIQGGKDLSVLLKIANEAAIEGSSRGHQIPSPSLMKRIEIIQELCNTSEPEEIFDTLYGVYGTGVETIESIPSALAIVLVAKGDPVLAAHFSASLGGDCDTIGSIASAICGSMNPQFKQEDIELLESVNQIDFNSLSEAILVYSPLYKLN